jgi:hypothetical protein
MPSTVKINNKSVDISNICEAYILKLHQNKWDVARISSLERPDYDVQLLKGNFSTLYEVKTQSANYNGLYIELGEVNSNKKKIIGFNYYSWYKSAFTLSEANIYTIFKGTYPNYNIYEISSEHLKTKINEALGGLNTEILRKNNEQFKLKKSNKLDDLINRIPNTGNFTNNNNDNLGKFAITRENDFEGNPSRINLNIVFNLDEIQKNDLGLHDVSTIFNNNEISRYFDGVEFLNKTDTLEEYKNNTPDNMFEILDSWKYELRFVKNPQTNYNIPLEDIFKIKAKSLVSDYIYFDGVKSLGLEKVGVGKYYSSSESDSSSSSEDDESCRKIYNRIKRNIDKKYKKKKEKYL